MTSDGQGSRNVVLAAVGGNGLITVVKAVGWLLTASPSLMAEAIHSLADTTNQVLLYVGIRHGQVGPSREYPFGKAPARYLWNLISAMGIFFIGFGVTTYHGIESLIHPHPFDPDQNLWIPIGILLFAVIVEGWVLIMAVRAIRHQKGSCGWLEYIRNGKDPTAVAVLLEDGVAVLGVIFAFIGILLSHFLQSNIPDAIASTLIGLLLGALAILLARSNSRFLIGVSTPEGQESELKTFLESLPSIEKVVSLKTKILGPRQLRVTAEVEFNTNALIHKEQIARDANLIRSGKEDPLPILVNTAERTVRMMGNAINEVERALQKRFPHITYIELEAN